MSRTSLESRGVVVTPWPPSIVPETQYGYVLMDCIVGSHPSAAVGDLAGQFPPGVTASGGGWRAPFIFEPDPQRAAEFQARHPGAMRLIIKEAPTSIPVLRHYANQLWHGKDRDALLVAGYPPTKSFLRALDRLDKNLYTLEVFRALREFWQDHQKRRFLQHAYRITTDVFGLMKMPEGRANAHLVAEAAKTPVGERTVCYALEMLTGEWAARLTQLDKALPWPFGNLKYEEMHPAAYRLSVLRNMTRSFPDTPLPGTNTIVPITSVQGLYREGRQMQNCAMSYHDQVVEGETYFYILHRSFCRCTVMLRNRGDHWCLEELKAKANGEPSVQALDEVLDWLARLQPYTDREKLDRRPMPDTDEPHNPLENLWDEDWQ